MVTKRWGKLLEDGMDRVQTRAQEKIRNGIDKIDDVFSADSDDDGDDEEEEEGEGSDADGDDGEADAGESSGEDANTFTSMSFDFTASQGGAARNKMLAVAAYRAFGVAGDMVAWHPSGTAFFGDMEEFDEFCSHRDMDDETWRCADEPAKILDLDYDAEDLALMVQDGEAPASAAAEDGKPAGRSRKRESPAEVFKAVHWGDEASTRTMLGIQGISTPLVQFGVARYSEYFARKNGEETEFWHQHGEESGVFPLIFVPANRREPGFQWYVVVATPGSKFRVDDDGIHD